MLSTEKKSKPTAVFKKLQHVKFSFACAQKIFLGRAVAIFFFLPI